MTTQTLSSDEKTYLIKVKGYSEGNAISSNEITFELSKDLQVFVIEGENRYLVRGKNKNISAEQFVTFIELIDENANNRDEFGNAVAMDLSLLRKRS